MYTFIFKKAGRTFMQNSTNSSPTPRFFAAANGFSGFRSYFPVVFNSSDFDRLFVLKGGPGTGKSSFLRSLLSFGEENGFSCEAVLCSSDPHSLDGVILEKSGKRFAALDGTAPHTRDTEIPGAADEIINLGENWNTEQLISNRRLIQELAKKKRINYEKAYSALNNAGIITDVENGERRCCVREEKIKSDAKSLAESLISSQKRGKEIIRLNDSFGRFGSFKVDTLEALSSQVIKVENTPLASVLFMGELRKFLKDADISMTVFPDVFNSEAVSAIYLHESRTSVVLSDSSCLDVKVSDFISGDISPELLDSLSQARTRFLDEAKKYFTFASDLHFELEKIYISAMNFGRNEILLEKTIEKIKKHTN